VVFILQAITIYAYNHLSTKAKKVEINSTISALRTNLVVDYAVTGRWSDKLITSEAISDELGFMNLVHQVEAKGGNITVTYETEQGVEYIESNRLVSKDKLQPTLYWVCGNHQPRNDEVVMADNQTNSPNKMLIHTCR
jgi:Tfp pilus assembly major pilin PilA